MIPAIFSNINFKITNLYILMFNYNENVAIQLINDINKVK